MINECMSALEFEQIHSGDRRVGETKKRTTLCVMVFCVGDDPTGIPRERGLYLMQHKHSQHSAGENTSQSVSSRA